VTTTKTKQILGLLAKGNMTFAELQKELKLDDAELRGVIGYLRQRNYIESIPMTYVLAFDGFKRLKHKPKSSPEELARNKAKNEKRARMADGLRARGIATSVFQLGAM
jgi:predicted transcriptional regulator